MNLIELFYIHSVTSLLQKDKKTVKYFLFPYIDLQLYLELNL